MRVRSSRRFCATLVLALGGAHALLACSDDFERPPAESADGSAGASGSGGTSGSSGTDGGSGSAGAGGSSGSDGGEDATPCDTTLAPSEAECVVTEELGIFVSPEGDDASGDGTRQAPLATINAALALASTKSKLRIYACEGTYLQAVQIASAGVSLFGGLSCADWTYTGAAATVAPSDPGVALRITNADDVVIEDFAFVAKDAASAGDSSIAAIVDGSDDVTFRRGSITAGKGAAGADAVAVTTPAATGAQGNTGQDECINALGGAQAQSSCGATTSVGGKGGNGETSSSGAQAGAPGTPDHGIGLGDGGAAQTSSGGTCVAGEPGAAGPPGNPGSKATGKGTLSADGYTGVKGGTGATGQPGQGGGGGGGAMHNGCNLANPALGKGAGGGSGGGGGCAGAGGAGGSAGGSSIALVSIDSTITLSSMQLVAVAGGNGGKGAVGQPGGNGGAPGAGGKKNSLIPSPGKDACSGGTGGKGGNGGPGGGGLGGHSIAIAHIGTAPSQDATTTTAVAQTAAPGGLGGGGSTQNQGDPGLASAVVDF